MPDPVWEKPQRTAEELRLSLEICNRRKLELEAAKKSKAAYYGGLIADQATEIDMLLQQLEIINDEL